MVIIPECKIIGAVTKSANVKKEEGVSPVILNILIRRLIMSICQKCGEYYPVRFFVDGKQRDFRNRKYCLKCSPFGKRNLCGPKLKLGIKMKGNDITVSCNCCGKNFITRNAQHDCPTCKSANYRHRQKEKAIDYLGGKCFLCGYDKCNKALVFHHINKENKKYALSTGWEKSFEKLKTEIDKCVLLCNRCHEEVHDGSVKITPPQ